jgi:WD40 repeat protein
VLLREWPRLRGWLEEDVEGRRLHRHIIDAARHWDAGVRDAGELYRGARLASALDWAGDHGAELNRLEREFLEESRLVSEREAERNRRANRRLRILLAAAAVALVGAVAAGVLALDQRGDARDARDAVVAAYAERLGGEALTAERLEKALLLARAGVELDESAATRSSLLTVLERRPAQLGTLPDTDDVLGDLWAVAVSPDGRFVAVSDEGGGVMLYDAASRRPLGKPYRFCCGGVQTLEFSPDGSTLAVGGSERLDLIDPRTRERHHRVALPSYPSDSVVAVALVFLANGRDLVVEQTHDDSHDHDAALEAPASVLTRLNVRTGAIEGRPLRVGRHASRGMSATADGRRLFVTVPRDNATYAIDSKRLRVLRRHPVGDPFGAVSPDGRLFALGSATGGLRLLDLRSGRVQRFRGRHDAAINAMRFAPDGRTVVTSGADGNVIVWDVERGELRETFSAHGEGAIWGLALSSDGRTLYSAGTDARAIVWDLAGDRRIVRSFEAGRPFAADDGNQYPVELALSPDGRTLARTHDDGTVELIDTRTLRRRGRVQALRGFAAAVDFSPDGRLLAVSGEGGQVTLWDARTLRSAGPDLSGLRTTSQALAFSLDAELLAVAELGTPNRQFSRNSGGDVRVWDVRRRALTGVRFKMGSPSVSFSPDGSLVAAAGRMRASEIRNARSGELVARLRTADWGGSVAFSPDGTLVATGDWGGKAQLWSTETWKPMGRPMEGHEGRILTLDFSPDGRTLTSAGEDGTVVLWDVNTRTPVGSPLIADSGSWVSAAFTPDGSHLFAVSDRGRGVRFDVRTEAWKRHACRVAGREFSARELSDALGDRPFRELCPSG